jgi:nucleotidyltransferase/DNA polymerase involved in DNA repair
MIACVVIEDFGLHAAGHGTGSPSMPLALTDDRPRRPRIATASAIARAHGVKPGMSLTRARALCPRLNTQPLRAEQVDTFRDRMLEALWLYTNRIEIDRAALPQTGIFWLDLGRTTDSDAAVFGQRIARTLERITGCARVGMARGKFTAHAAALHGDGLCIVPRRCEAEFLAPLPVTLIDLDREAARRLDLLGIRTLSQLAALPRTTVSAQFGRVGRRWHAWASGQDGRPVTAFKLPDYERVGHDFEDAISDRAMLNGLLARMSQALAGRLDSRAAAAQEIALTLHFDRGATHTQRLQRIQPLAECLELRRTLESLLDKHTIDAPVSAISITLSRLVPLTLRQMELFSHRPHGRELLDLVPELNQRYGLCFFTAALNADNPLPERRFSITAIQAEDAS